MLTVLPRGETRWPRARSPRSPPSTPPQPPQKHHLLFELHLVYHRPHLVAQRPRLPAQDLLRVVEPNLRVLRSRQLGRRVFKGPQDRRRERGEERRQRRKSVTNIETQAVEALTQLWFVPA